MQFLAHYERMSILDIMTEDDAKQWVKDKFNQTKVLKHVFADCPVLDAKVAFFMAGIPGAGKTEFAESITGDDQPMFIPIEHDKLVEYIDGYKPENYYNFRKAGSTLVTLVFDQVLKTGHSFIFDGTLSHENGSRNIKKALNAGYEVFIIYIVQDAKVAWELTKARELVKKRSIEKSGFINTCNKINSNLKSIFSSFESNSKFNMWVIHKRGLPGVENATAVMHGSGLDQRQEIVKELNNKYNLEDIG